MLKLADLAKSAKAGVRLIVDVKDAKLEFEGLTVSVKHIKLSTGETGNVVTERWPDFVANSLEEGDGGQPALKASVKLSPKGYYYDSNELKGAGKPKLVLGE